MEKFEKMSLQIADV